MSSNTLSSCHSDSPVTKAPATGRVFNIQRYSLNDGAGIRTVVFFKGCPLSCPWCSNPESRSPHPENVRREAKCLNCDVCEEDVDECPSGAFEQVGQDMTIKEILKEITRDEVFYRTSGGGVTLSGGEILVQPVFATELLKRLKALGYHTAIETTGVGSQHKLLELAAYCDEVLFDLKIMNPDRAKQVIGMNLSKVLDNFSKLVQQGVHVIPRLPLIPGYTLDILNVDSILNFLKPFHLKEIHLLPFHQLGANKYDTFGLEYQMKDIPVPGEGEVESIRTHIEAHGYKVITGG